MLEKIKSPEDLKNIDEKDLLILCQEIREYIEEKKPVFLWNKLFLDMVKQYKGKMTKDELVEMLSDIKDFNQFQLKFKKSPIYKLFDIDKYFSRDELDIYYLMTLKELVKTM